MSDSNRFGNLTLKVFRPSDGLPEIVEKLQFNFDQILLNGGGPVGNDGNDGRKGEIGATGIGEQGIPGTRGSYIYFVNTATVNGQPVTNPNHLVGDTIIDASGNYYQVVDVGGTLQYIFQFNLSLASLIQYLKSQYDYGQGGSNPITKFVLRDNGAANSATERNLVLAIRRPNSTTSSEDQSEFYRLILGLDTYPGTDNSPLTICNIIPEGVTNAMSAPFNQLSFRYRDTIISAVSATKADIKYKIVSAFTTFSLENLSTAFYLRHNSTDTNLSETIVKGKNVILSGSSTDESTITEYVKFIIGSVDSYLKPIKNLIFQSADPTGTFAFENNLIINNRLIFKTDLDSAGTTVTGNTLDISSGKSIFDISSGTINKIINGKHGQIFAIKAKSDHLIINDVIQSGASGNILIGNRNRHYLNKNQQIMFICYESAKIANIDIDNSQTMYFVEISSSYSSLVASNLSSTIHGNDLNFFTTPGIYKLLHDPANPIVTNLPTEFMSIATRNPSTIRWDLKLEVKTEQGGTDVIQTLHAFQLDETNSDPHWIAVEGIYYRNKRSDSYYIPVWSSWNQTHLSNHNVHINRGVFRLPINIDIPVSGAMVINSTGSTANQKNSNFYIVNNPSGNILKSISFPVNTGNWYTMMFKDATILALVDVSCNIFPKPYRTYRFKAGTIISGYWDGTNYSIDGLNVQIEKDMIIDYVGSSSNFLANGLGINDFHGYALTIGGTITLHGVNITLPDTRHRFRVSYDPTNVGSYGIGVIGGIDLVTLTRLNIPPHRHKYFDGYMQARDGGGTYFSQILEAVGSAMGVNQSGAMGGGMDITEGSGTNREAAYSVRNTSNGTDNYDGQDNLLNTPIPIDNKPLYFTAATMIRL